jgi:hypothetical protein
LNGRHTGKIPEGVPKSIGEKAEIEGRDGIKPWDGTSRRPATMGEKEWRMEEEEVGENEEEKEERYEKEGRDDE